MSELRIRNILSPDGGVPDNLKPVTASAWVSFNGTGVVSIRDSYNVSSITDNGTGNYTVNLDNALADNFYSAFMQVGGTTDAYLCRTIEESIARSNSSISFIAATQTLASRDPAYASVLIFGGQS